MQFITITDPDTGYDVRQGARNDVFVLDIEVNDTGFAGVENTAWMNEDKITP